MAHCLFYKKITLNGDICRTKMMCDRINDPNLNNELYRFYTLAARAE